MRAFLVFFTSLENLSVRKNYVVVPDKISERGFGKITLAMPAIDIQKGSRRHWRCSMMNDYFIRYDFHLTFLCQRRKRCLKSDRNGRRGCRVNRGQAGKQTLQKCKSAGDYGSNQYID
jgi:hypothetical protein